jgi:integrase
MKVTIENLEGRLRLRWTCPETGKRKNLALGVDESTTGRAYAATIKDRIESDVKHGYYDPTLLKYRPRTIGKNATEITTVELFDRFTQHQFKHEGLAQSSIKSRYQPVTRMLEKHLNIQAMDVDKRRAERFADVCNDTLTAGTAKARIMLLKSAWDWGKGRYQLANENPFQGLAKRFRSLPVKPNASFTKDEVKRIIQGFRDSRYYAHYADYVMYRFGMGTRGGEASALKWKHISSDFRSVWIGESYSRGVTGSTKTKRARTVVMPEAIATMLKDRKQQLNPQSDDELVFPSPEGLPICDRMFNRRAWKTVLADVGVPYRRPYTTRKTAGNHAIAAGANYLDVAAALGHDPATFHKSYAESINQTSIFISFE